MRNTRPSRFLRFFWVAVLAIICCFIQPYIQSLQAASSPASNMTQLVEQGAEAYQQNQYLEAISYWEQALEHSPATEVSQERAIILENLAHAHQQVGDFLAYLDRWKEVTAIYTTLRNWEQVGRTLTEQAQAYRYLGQPLQAISLLCEGHGTLPEAASLAIVTNQPQQSSVEGGLICQSESAVDITQRTRNLEGQMAALGSLGEAYRSVQNYPTSLQALYQGLAIAERLDNPQYKALLHNSLGHTYREQTELSYQQAAASLRSASGDEKQFYNSAQQAREDALKHFAESRFVAQQANYPALEIKALLGLIAVHAQTDSQARVTTLWHQAIPLLERLPPTQEKAYLALQLTKQSRPLATPQGTALKEFTYQSSQSECTDIIREPDAWILLEQANAIAETLENDHLKAFSRGTLGHFYECSGNASEALEWTRAARLAASEEDVVALDTLYLWQWQMGRIYKRLRQFETAIESYKQATIQLGRVRDDILASNQTLQFDFRDAVVPVYRELAEIQLSLQPAAAARARAEGDSLTASTAGTQVASEVLVDAVNIKEALENIDQLQLAELQNYFGSDCIVPISEYRLDETLGQEGNAGQQAIEASTALISTVLFADKTAVILTLPQQTSQVHWIQLPEAQFRQTIIDFRNSLEDTSNELEGYDISLAQMLYGEIMSPFEEKLADNHIKTLIFVNDGILRNIPMAALYDGKQYLAERYSVAIAPSLQRPDISNKVTSDLRALVLGLTQDPIIDGAGLGSLPAVRLEVQDVLTFLPGSDLLLDEELTQENLRQKLKNSLYPVLHFATHGRFGTDPEDTFLVMGDKQLETADVQTEEPENKRLRLGELDALIREGAPREELLDLIVLSACQTASGDERSTLGLAGVTIRAGAKSALASLWSVNDKATADLITYFYQSWINGLTKAEALRAAQIKVMQDPRYLGHPAYWSAFVLVGDWQ